MKQSNRFFRDGTSQVNRMPDALAPAFVSVEERSTKELLQYVRRYADYLRYIGLDGKQDGHWSALFDFTDEELEALIAYAQDPSSFDGDQATLDRFSRPHLSLFVTFLKLLEHPRQQFDDLTERHLDHYYREVLELAEKAAVPDKLHAVLQPVLGQNPHLVEQGTMLDAGKDSAGQALVYATDEQIVVSQAKLGDVKTVYVEDADLDPLYTCNRYLKKVNYKASNQEAINKQIAFYQTAGFNDLFRWAFGVPQGGKLPPICSGTEIGDSDCEEKAFDQDYQEIWDTHTPTDDKGPIDSIWIKYLESRLENRADAVARAYLREKLFLEESDFVSCMGIVNWEARLTDIKPDRSDWERIFDILEAAFERRLAKESEGFADELVQEYPCAADFNDMTRFAFGSPVPDSSSSLSSSSSSSFSSSSSSTFYVLPPFSGRDQDGMSLDLFVNDPYIDPDSCAEVIDLNTPGFETYITTNLFMTVDEFKEMMILRTKSPWPDRLYEIIATAMVQRRFEPFRQKIANVVATTVGAADPGNPAELTQFHPFTQVPEENSAVASVGFAISSPIFNLEEGRRTVTLTFVCQPNSFDYKRIENLILDNPIDNPDLWPFELYFSSADQWLKIESLSMSMGWLLESDIICTDGVEETDRPCFRLTFSLEKDFPAIAPFSADAEVTDIESAHPILKCLLKKLAVEPFNTSHPSLCNQSESALPDEATYFTLYDQLRNVQLERVYIEVDVKEVENLLLANDQSVLKPEKPFEPFGLQPVSGSALYLGSKELCQKKLDNLSFNVEWMDLPGDMAAYYGTYFDPSMSSYPEYKGEIDAPSSSSSSADNGKIDNSSFTAKLKLLVKNSWQDAGDPNGYDNDKPLFVSAQGDGKKTDSLLTIDFADIEATPDYDVQLFPEEEEYEAPSELPRYFKWELGENDFLHKRFATAQRNALLWCYSKSSNELGVPCDTPPEVNDPYTPVIKAFSLDYSSSATIDFTSEGEDVCDIHDRLIQVHPFGHLYTWPVEPRHDTNTTASLTGVDTNVYYLLPQYDRDGYLYMGFWDLQPAQSLSLLFKPIIFTGDSVNYQAPEIKWQSLYQNYWDDFCENDVEDTTRGLLTEGVVKLVMPTQLDDENHLMPAGRRWIVGSLRNDFPPEPDDKPYNVKAIPELANIHPQAVRATFQDMDNADDHLTLPLTAESVKGFVDSDPAIESVTQHYNSFNGRPAEKGPIFYTRVSERLRHKDRALSSWDYERMVLAQFPSIYNVKCLMQAEMSQLPLDEIIYRSAKADVAVVVIPDIANTAPLFPLTPMAPQYLLDEIRDFLAEHISPFVSLEVKNPRYERIKYELRVKFKKGWDPAYYMVKINEDLKEFLSPWAFKKHAPISFGSRIQNSKVVHFLDSLEYVDYIVDFKLWLEKESSIHDPLAVTAYGLQSEDVAQTRFPDSILVSAETHDITLIEEDYYNKPEGIGHMEIEKDFYIYSYYTD